MDANRMTKSTKTMKAVESNVTITECCEPKCGMTILVEKDEVAQGRKTRCMACVMQSKMSLLK